MSVVDAITKATPFQQLCIALMLLIGGASTGMVYENHNHIQSGQVTLSEVQQQELITQIQNYDPFWDEAQEVNAMMQSTFEYPTDQNLRRTNNNLKISREAWASRGVGGNKELYQAYLKACEKVIDDLQTKKEANTAEMDKLYSKLNPTNN